MNGKYNIYKKILVTTQVVIGFNVQSHKARWALPGVRPFFCASFFNRLPRSLALATCSLTRRHLNRRPFSSSSIVDL